MARIERLRVYPLKGFDGEDVRSAAVREGGTLAGDREWALFDADGAVLNGKRTERVHAVSTEYSPAEAVLVVEGPGGDRRTFALADERSDAEDWFGAVFDADLELRRNRSAGFVDRPDMGPSIVSTATLRTVASWFEGMDVDGARRRLRANVEVSGVPAFWEDRFVGDGAPAFRAGDVRVEGVTPCGRCVVPERDPETGEPIPEFRERFVEQRRETFPEWADRDAFEHLYAVMLIARIPESDRGERLAVGDPVEMLE